MFTKVFDSLRRKDKFRESAPEGLCCGTPLQVVNDKGRETSRLKQRFQVALDEFCFPNRSAKLRREDEIPWLGSGRSGFFFQSAKEICNPILQLDHPPAAFPF